MAEIPEWTNAGALLDAMRDDPRCGDMDLSDPNQDKRSGMAYLLCVMRRLLTALDHGDGQEAVTQTLALHEAIGRG